MRRVEGETMTAPFINVRRSSESFDSNMANVRDSDTSLWLHNKLGTSNDSWTGSSICSQLNAEVLRNIKDCFPDLQTQVKLKLLLSFFHIPRRNVEEVTIHFSCIFCMLIFNFYLNILYFVLAYINPLYFIKFIKY